MLRQLEKIEEEKEELNKIAQSQANKKLKYLALSLISVGIVLLLIMIVFYEKLSRESILIMRGFVGVLAIFFVIIVTIYLYRIHTEFQKQRYKTKKENRNYEKL